MSDSESDDAYGPALPPGLKSAEPKATESSSDDDAYGPALPPKPGGNSNPEQSRIIGPSIPSHLAKKKAYSSDSESDSDSDSDRESRKKARVIGPSIPSAYLKKIERSSEPESIRTSNIGPELPPHLKHLSNDIQPDIGPVLPSGFSNSDDEDDDSDVIGPSLGLRASEHDKSSAGREFELRAEKMKEKLTGKSEVSEGPAGRESWMTELPDNMGANFGMGPRQFRKNAAPEQDSSWTETPQDKERKEKEGKREKKEKAVGYMPSEREINAAKEIERYNKKHRSESLLEMHEKERKKKKKKEKKKNKDKPVERRPFDRDADLQVNKMDDAKRRAIIKRSQDLGSRFKSGGTGTSFL